MDSRNRTATASRVPNTLTAALLPENGNRDQLYADCVQLIEMRAQRSPGIKGMALRTGLGMLKSTRPDILPRAVRRLLPEFVTALEPFYAEFRLAAAQGVENHQDFSAFLLVRRDAAVQAVLATADAQASGSRNTTVRGFYGKVRGTIANEIHSALPTLCRRIDIELQRGASA